MSKTNSLYISKHSDKICILGKSFGLPDDSDENDKKIVDSINKELIDFISKICWFSYRRNIKTMVYYINNKQIT